jgi:hypothetical protein
MISEQHLTSCLNCGLRPWPSVHFVLGMVANTMVK